MNSEVESSHKCRVYRIYWTWFVSCATCDWWVGANFYTQQEALDVALRHKIENQGHIPGWRKKR